MFSETNGWRVTRRPVVAFVVACRVRVFRIGLTGHFSWRGGKLVFVW
jgi:hypothetical protein